MPVAAVPTYLGQKFEDTSPGMRFGMYLKLWGVDERSGAVHWKTHDWIYRERGRDRRIRRLKQDNKRSALDTACRLDKNSRLLNDALVDRQRRTAAALPDCIAYAAIATAPFTTGLGNEHPLENGFAFLWPYGLPYLPGSGVKGVLRQAVRELVSGEWGESEWSVEPVAEIEIDKKSVPLTAIDVLFGLECSDHQKKHFRGVLNFWDVIPLINGNKLMVEIMTPHQKHYYQGNKPPHDSGEPNLINFLTVPPGSEFVFHVQCDHRRLEDIAPELAAGNRWQALLKAAFEHAFDWLGFGAKTAVGYGAMRVLTGEERAAQESARERARVRCEWVDEQIDRLAGEHNSPPENVLRGKALAEAWQAIEDPDLRARALADIRARWEEHGWWEAPPGKAAAKARRIYSSGEEGEEAPG